MASEAGHLPNRPYISLDGNMHLNGATLYDGSEVPIPAAANVGQSVTITNAASTANISLVTFQVKDGSGTALAVVAAMKIWLSDAATGIGLTATTASGAVAASTSGTDIGTLTTKKALDVITDTTGKYILSITDTAKTTFYPACAVGGKVTVGAQLTAGSYG